MSEQKASLEMIDNFLSHKRIAMVGLSRERKEFSSMLFEEFRRRGYDVVPVNPGARELFGCRSFARVQDIQPPVEAVLLMTSPQVTEMVVKDCAEAGIQRVWMYRAGGPGAVSEAAIQFCREHGIEVIPGECPFMFWRNAGFGHRLHGFILKLIGRYPHKTHAVHKPAA